MKEKNKRILEIGYNPDGDVVGYINTKLSEEEVLMAYSLLTHAMVIALTEKYMKEQGNDLDEAVAEAWRKVVYAADLAHEYSEELSDGAEVSDATEVEQ